MASNLKADKPSMVDQPRETGPWDPALAKLSEWDPAWAATSVRMTTNPWTAGVLPRKFVELVSVGLNAAPPISTPTARVGTSALRLRRAQRAKKFFSYSNGRP